MPISIAARVSMHSFAKSEKLKKNVNKINLSFKKDSM
jgi:hypothetical protein